MWCVVQVMSSIELGVASIPSIEDILGVGCPVQALIKLLTGDFGDSAVADVADGAASDIGHADIHQFPGIEASKSQFFDNVNLGDLSDTSGTPGTLQANGNTRFVLHAPEDIGIDRTTGLPTNLYTVIRGSDGNVVTIFPGTSPRS